MSVIPKGNLVVIGGPTMSIAQLKDATHVLSTAIQSTLKEPTVAGFARATPPQEGIIRENPKSTQSSPKAKLQPDSKDEEAPT